MSHVSAPSRPSDIPETRAAFAQWVARHGAAWYKQALDDELGETIAGGVNFEDLSVNVAHATAYWVTAPMCTLTDAASRTYQPTADVLPIAPHGVVFFATPLDVTNTDGTQLPVMGFIWEPEVCYPITGHRLALGIPLVTRGSTFVLEATRPNDQPRLQLVRIIQVFWLLVAQRLTVTTAARPDRAARRRCARMDIPEGEVQIVDLRRLAHTSSDAAGTAVDWSHRWMVDGHWRNQYFPSEDTHRPLWIAPHVKGPEDRPLVVRERVYRWRR